MNKNWIKYSDSSPSMDGDYYVCTKHGEVSVLEYSLNAGKFGYSFSYGQWESDEDDIQYWMEIDYPKPPSDIKFVPLAPREIRLTYSESLSILDSLFQMSFLLNHQDEEGLLKDNQYWEFHGHQIVRDCQNKCADLMKKIEPTAEIKKIKSPCSGFSMDLVKKARQNRNKNIGAGDAFGEHNK